MLLRNLLNNEEVSRLKRNLESDPMMTQEEVRRDDGDGRQSKSVMWNTPAKDITGMIGRSEKLAGTFEKVNNNRRYFCV